ncbi:MAG: CxxxxCH/CxxCH domain-containing protein, partial [Dehalococcoidia bacterium]
TCSTASCHANVYGAGVVTTPTWGSTGAGCSACHTTAIAATGPATGSHVLHNETDCTKCHNAGASATTRPTLEHADGLIDTALVGYTDEKAKGTPFTTCSTASCHANVYGAGVVTTPTWGSTGAGCSACHTTAIAATGPATGTHTKHMGLAAAVCTQCHNAGTSATTAPTTEHADGLIDTANVGYTDEKAKGTPFTTCSTIYCHSNVQGAGGSGAPSTYATPTWGGAALTCASCHKDMDTDAAATGNHTKHAQGSYNIECATCHNGYTETTVDSATHSNNLITLNFSGSGTGTTYSQGNSHAPGNGYGTCSTSYCHGSGTPTWGGGALKCSDCHASATADTNDYTYNNSTMAKIYSAQWTYAGHGRATASGVYIVTGNAPADFPLAAGTGDPCLYCHDGTGVLHGNATNVFRLRNFADVTYGKNGNCLKCHGTGQTGVDPDGAGVVYSNKTAAKKIDKYHYGSQHSAALNGGTFCWDCHDPHGDSTGVAGPIAMVQLNPAQASNATTGAPTTVTSNAVAFTARSVASDYGSTVATKICNVCHTYKAADPNKMVHYYNSGSFTDSHNSATLCTVCHKHSSDTTYNGEAFKGGGCNGCHDYDTRVAINWGTGYTAQAVEGFGAHKKHIDHIKARFSVTLNPNTDTYGTGNAANVCGTCHTNLVGNHSTGGGPRSINFGDSTYKEGGAAGFSFLFGATPPVYNGVVGTSSSVNLKSCSAVGCHFKTTPAWNAY